uniref:Uncharacterized protein n=1 Tax=Medicago truncatula TaxID=3880 RepID=A2Q6H4_MEDTR|nr:hypothetical protein MtrDRAFT_AC184047g5v2 [Medicago truncatula]
MKTNNVIPEAAFPPLAGPMSSIRNGNRNQTTEQNPPPPPPAAKRKIEASRGDSYEDH